MPAQTRLAASVVLARRNRESGRLEAFWVRRGAELRFAGGFYAFPGGRVDAADFALPVQSKSIFCDDERASIAAAARELFEETGVLPVANAARVSVDERSRARTLLTARPEKGGKDFSAHLFAGLLARHDLKVDGDRFVPAGRWITPPSVPTRFDTRFYLHEVDAHETAVVWPGELADGEWITPESALARWESGSALLHPPAWHTLRSLALAQQRGDLREAIPLLQYPARAPWKLPIEEFVVERMEFQRGIMIVPLRTPTLFPATHTNCLLLGDESLLVVDPGSPWKREQQILRAALDDLEEEGRRAKAILLTHYHHDHVAGAMALSAERGLPILAHAETASRLEGEVRVDRLVADDEELQFGPRGFRALHLPGHTRGHLCLLEKTSGTVIAGDLVAGQSTVVIDPPEGDMADYLTSLERLISYTPQTIYPAHGQVVPGGEAMLRGYVKHRLEREAKVLAALRDRGSPSAPEDLVPGAYPEIKPELYPLAERSLLAHLLKLVKDGTARVDAAGQFEIV